MITTDITFHDAGSIILVTFRSEAAQEWKAENIGESDEHQYLGGALAIEHRYADDILLGAQNDGLTVAAL